MSATPEEEEDEAADTRTSRSGAAPLLRWLVRAASLAALRREATAVARNIGLRFVLRLATAILWLLVAAFLVAAFTVWLSGKLGAIAACAVIAGGFAVIALVLHLVIARLARRRHHWNFEQQFPGLSEAIGNTTLDEKTLGALAIAALAGFFLAIRGKH